MLAHNLIRWTTTVGQVRVADLLTVARTVRTRLINLPGRLVNRPDHPHCVSQRSSWRTTFNTALNALRLLRPAPT